MILKDYRMGYLIKRLREEGILTAKTIAGTRVVLSQWFKRGILKLRTKPHTKHRVVNEYEVKEIVKELKPGGKGKWSSQEMHIKDIKMAEPKVS